MSADENEDAKTGNFRNTDFCSDCSGVLFSGTVVLDEPSTKDGLA